MAATKKKVGGRRAPHANPVKLTEPGEDDILCGKDRACALHKGSQRFRAVIDSYRATYQKAVTKYDKMCITKEIYEVLSQKARFLKYNDKEKLWEEITPLQGRDKIGHALRFANNHNAGTKGTKAKRSRKALKRQGSFSSASCTSNTSSVAAVRPSKAELVKSLVEVAKEEPKVMDAIVDHLTLQDALNTAPADSVTSDAALEAAAAHHQRVASIVDSVCLENIAYAMDTNKEDDTALDELINLLNHDETIQEEDIQDILDLAAEEQEVPPTIAISSMMPDNSNMEEDDGEEEVEEDVAVPNVATSTSAFAASSPFASKHHREYSVDDIALPTAMHGPPKHTRKYSVDDIALTLTPAFGAGNHQRVYSVDDDIWSVMKEPIMDLDWQ